jgi:hypothetical protein
MRTSLQSAPPTTFHSVSLSTGGMTTHSVYIFTRPLMYIPFRMELQNTQQNVKLLTPTE